MHMLAGWVAANWHSDCVGDKKPDLCITIRLTFIRSTQTQDDVTLCLLEVLIDLLTCFLSLPSG